MALGPSTAGLGAGAPGFDQTVGHATDATPHLSVSWHNSSTHNNLSDHPCQVVFEEFDVFPKDDPDDIIPLETGMLGIKVVCGALLLPLASSGLLLNVLSMMVFLKQGLRQRINALLFCLACADFLLLVHFTMYAVDFFFIFHEGPFHIIGPVQEIIANQDISILYGFVYVSGFISTMIAVERYICISHPFIAKKILKTKAAGAIVIVSTAVLVGGHSFASSKYRVRCGSYPEKDITLKGFYPSQFFVDNRFLVDVLNVVVYGLALPIFFFLTTTVTTVITAVKLRSAATWRRGQTSAAEADSKEVAVTRMLIAVSCVFIVCSIPNNVMKLTPFFLPEFSKGIKNQNLLLLGHCLKHYIPAINSSINFFFYFKMGSRFRAVLKSMCCPASRKAKETMECQDTNASVVSSVRQY